MPVHPLFRSWFFTIAALSLLYIAGVTLRAHRLEVTLPDPDAPFWLESAQHYRGIRFIAEGKPLPDPDRQIQWPDGFDPTRDTVVQEYVIGGLARLIEPPSLPHFVRSATRYVYCLVVLPLFWLAWEVTRRRWAALFGVAVYLTLPAALERSTGLVVFRENVALPILALQIAALYAHFRRDRGSFFAWLSGAALLLAHFTWKVTTFYQLFLLGFLALLCLWRSPDARVRSAVYALGLPPLLVSISLPVALNIDRYWGSTQAALTGALLLLCLVARFRPGMAAPAWARAGLLALAFLGLRQLLPGPVSYDHAWDTLIAKVRFLGQKPADPSELSIHARHYWTGNYRSPTFARAVREFALPALFCAMVLPRMLKRWAPSRSPADAGALFLALGLAGFFVGYLMFQKFGTLLALFITPAVALGALTTWERAERHTRLAAGVLAGTLLFSTWSGWTGIGAEAAVGQAETIDRDVGVVYSQASMNELALWLEAETAPQDAFLTSWALAPFLFTYLDRNTILHSFFECDVVTRYEDFNRRLFAPLEEFHAFARQYKATYFIYEANFLLRIDPWMSYRYVADHLVIRGDEAAWRLHYTPEEVPGFALVYQNDFFRVYRVLEDPTARVTPATVPYVALFDPAVPGAQPGQPLEAGPALLYGTLEAGRWLQIAAGLQAEDRAAEALVALREGLRAGPYHPGAYQAAIRALVDAGQLEPARKLRSLALTRFGGRVALPEVPEP